MNRILVAIIGLCAIVPQVAQAKARTVDAVVTAYCPCRECCGPDARGITSTGQDARTSGCAVDPRHIAYGSRVRVPGIGWRTADDTGGAMRANGRRGIIHIDIRMRSHEQALRFGVKRTTIRIEEARGES